MCIFCRIKFVKKFMEWGERQTDITRYVVWVFLLYSLFYVSLIFSRVSYF